MNVTVRLSAGLSQHGGNTRLSLQLPEGATVTDLLAQLRREHPELDPNLESAVPIIAGRLVGAGEPLHGDQEVAFLLPISGGNQGEGDRG